jgi:hypothetical protein
MIMKLTLLCLSVACCWLPVRAYSQLISPTGALNGLGGAPTGPRFGGALSKLFGENDAFTASLAMEFKESGRDDLISLPGRILFLKGKTRFEMDVTEAKGTPLPAAAAAQLKAFGLSQVALISRPDKKLAYMVYPGLQSYIENELDDDEATEPGAKFDVNTTELGKEMVDGQACVKNKVVLTDQKGNKREAVVWNAAALKDFPIKMQYAEEGRDATLTFRDISFTKPDSAAFDPPAAFARYEGMAGFVRGIMLKQLTGKGPVEKK